ncbi:hypothetical protein CONLIGDRAFT_392194 [Coniochaeta ligniaria NRRL 30616]|uniref:Uncharacterized protein n=1 Tax=Coniochaeta ligniaria NRRL 30616 TaxID=1408157 RepID=A0A1J7INN5_9PEZI|nr:hypothetical protein CONLIGDRAFT_392194 [Coniochaeta ligniaria NRRL 30616]
MDFAPYQSSPPEHGRTLSPGNDGVSSPRASWESASNRPRRISVASPPPLQHPQPQRAWSGDGIRSPIGGGAAGYQAPGGYQDASPTVDGAHAGGAAGMVGDYFGALGAREGMVSEFDTSLGIRLDYEACLAYLAFPPLGPILLLVLERKSDYVRFHAWQSSLLFTAMFLIHLIFSWSRFLSWVLFIGDIVLIGWLVLRAYRDADTLDRFEVPFIGPIASRILDDE